MDWSNTIAEYKPRSPWGWEGPDVSVEDFIAAYPDVFAYSIHVTPKWGGKWSFVERAQQATDKPILVKGLLCRHDLAAARVFGAKVLLVEGINADDLFDVGISNAVVEVHTMEQLVRALERNPSRIAVNARDLSTGVLYSGRHDELRPMIPDDIFAIAASGLGKPREDYDASLIGTALMEALR